MSEVFQGHGLGEWAHFAGDVLESAWDGGTDLQGASLNGTLQHHAGDQTPLIACCGMDFFVILVCDICPLVWSVGVVTHKTIFWSCWIVPPDGPSDHFPAAAASELLTPDFAAPTSNPLTVPPTSEPSNVSPTR